MKNDTNSQQIAKELKESNTPVIEKLYDINGEKLLAIGLKKGVILKEHTAPGRAKIMVVQGIVSYKTASEILTLEIFDSFEIPQKIKHSVEGITDTIFLLRLNTAQ